MPMANLQRYLRMIYHRLQLISLNSSRAFKPTPNLRPSPFDLLPAELIIEIIRLAANDSDPESAGNFAVQASLVCPCWRALVLATPMFWTTIRISGWNWCSRGPAEEAHCLERELLRASAFMARSSRCPIHVFILACPLQGQYGAQITASSISTVITPHLHRVVRYCLEYEGFGFGDAAAMIPSGKMPLLKFWSVLRVPWIGLRVRDAVEPLGQIVLPNFQRLDGETDDGNQAETSPNLEHMTLSFTGLAWSRITPRNLRDLELFNLSDATRPTWPELRDVLQANASTLTRLVLDGSCPMSPDTCEPFSMPALLSLHLSYIHPLSLEQFTTICQVPRLERLLIFNRGDTRAGAQHPRQESAFASIMQHIPLEQILYFHLSGVRFPPISYTSPTASTEFPYAMFRRLSSLRTLRLTAVNASMLRALNASTLEPHQSATELPIIHLPKLSHLYVKDINIHTLKSFLVERTRNVKRGYIERLSELHVCFPEGVWGGIRLTGLSTIARVISNTTVGTHGVVIF
ncbi:hypothetical protein BD779DRAFT_1477217 [Infundibulicybe gibba]|nr:hypothetical protein BD779DRAFT_1477217 [Infundibulicybe gibba]